MLEREKPQKARFPGKVGYLGRIVIPIEWRKALDLEEGDAIWVEVEKRKEES